MQETFSDYEMAAMGTGETVTLTSSSSGAESTGKVYALPTADQIERRNLQIQIDWYRDLIRERPKLNLPIDGLETKLEVLLAEQRQLNAQ